MNKKNAIIITGGSSGLGKEILKLSVKESYEVICVSRRIPEQRINNVQYYECNVGDCGAITNLCEKLMHEYNIRQIYHTAGSPAYCSITDINDEQMREALESNFLGIVYITSALLEHMQDQDSASIVGILSTAAKKGNPKEAAYTSAKWASRGYLECLRAACKGTKVRVLTVYPGGMNTEFWEKESYLKPDVESFMDPGAVAQAVVDAASAVTPSGFSSSLTIERH